jgi:hypothetical protein
MRNINNMTLTATTNFTCTEALTDCRLSFMRNVNHVNDKRGAVPLLGKFVMTYDRRRLYDW